MATRKLWLMPLEEAWASLQVRVLRNIAPPVPAPLSTIYNGKSKLGMLLGSDFLGSIRGLTVLDFGCGEGTEVVEMAKAGAGLTIGVENRESMLQIARDRAAREGVAHLCQFTAEPEEAADVIVSLDCFEHFAEPEVVLNIMYDLLKPGGYLMATWGPPWRHPYGAHLLELPPWSHLFFTEKAIMKWRSLMRDDGATCYSECGLNRMTVRRFEGMILNSRFHVEFMRPVPIRKLKLLHNRVTREFITSVVQRKLRR